MRTLFIVIMMMLTTAVSPIFSLEKGHPINVKVNGLVCSFCAQGIKNRFLELKEVKTVNVSLGKKTVTLELKPNAVLSDQTIAETVNKAGYTMVRVER
jgi:copper chaperone CopZ